MTDGHENLESELARMRPRAMSDSIAQRIGEKLSVRPRWTWPDRFLLATMSGGALAACVIIAMLAQGATTSVDRSSAMTVKVNSTLLPESPIAVARADAAWLDPAK
jgi:hypothetical protein